MMHPLWECLLEKKIIERISVRISMLLFIVTKAVCVVNKTFIKN